MKMLTTTTTARATIAGLITVAALGLAACGSDEEKDPTPEKSSASAEDTDEKSAEDILEDASDALLETESVTLQGAGEDDGSVIELDMSYTGEDVTGRIVLDGAGFEILSTEGAQYVLLDDAFWTDQAGVPADQLAMVSGKWLPVDPTDPEFGDFASFADREEFIDELLSPEGELSVGESEEIDGTEYTVLVSTKDGKETKLYIDAETNLPLKISDETDLEFSYDDVDVPEAPSADQQIDPTLLG